MGLEPLDGQDDERTIIKPTPGGLKRPAVRTLTPAPGLAQPLAPAQTAAFDFALLANSSFNVVVGAATQLLNLGRRLRGSVSNRDVGALRTRVVEEIKAFERTIMAAAVQPEQARAAHYAICATLDDIVLTTPWGAYSEWARNSMVSTFHADVTGGERFFDLLTHLHKDPGTNRDVLALMYLCLSIGFEGRMRVIDQGALELGRIRESLYRTLRQVHGDFERELSPSWRGVEARHRPIRSAIALWTIGSLAVALLIGGYVLFSYLLNRDSDRTLQLLAAAPPHPPVSLAVQAPAPVPHVAASALDGLRSALAAPIAAHQLEVDPAGKNLLVRLYSTGMFGSGSAVIQDKFKPVIATVARAIAAQQAPDSGAAQTVLILGHTDNQPIHSARFPSNFELSTARAQAVADLLAGMPHVEVKVLGKSDTIPIAPNTTAAGREKNRRTELVLTGVATAGGADGAAGDQAKPGSVPSGNGHSGNGQSGNGPSGNGKPGTTKP